MTVTARKYNPGFLSDDDLVASFCVRTDEFDSMIEILCEPSGNSNAHQIVIGPRGSGKTSLLLRVAAEIRRDDRLSSRFFPVVFAEESYEVSTAGEFWLECVSRLAEQAPRGQDRPDLRRSFEELRQIRDDRTLGDRCLGVLQDFSDREGRRLVLIVENLNMLFRDIADRDAAGWRLRQTLQNEPRILMLASATSRFDEIDDPNRALYDLFRVLTLRPLTTEDCATLWQAVSGQDRAPQTIRALRILTGGSPRLLTIVARFGAELSFRELMADLLDLVDDHTEYFKSHLDALPAQERRVYLALADLWKPATAREIADRARLETSKCSAQLARLTERGAVEVTGGSARRKLYYVAERLYNIYYLMRRSRGPSPLIEALIRFMEGYYSAAELREFGTRIAQEASGLDGETLRSYPIAFEKLVRLPSLEAHRAELLSFAPATLVDGADDLANECAPPSLARELVRKARTLRERGLLEDAVDVSDEVVSRFGASPVRSDLEQVGGALINRGMALRELQRPDEALASWDEVVERFGTNDLGILPQAVATALVWKGVLLSELDRPEEALSTWDGIVHHFGVTQGGTLQRGVASALVGKGFALSALDRLDEALAAYDEILRRFGASDAGTLLDLVAVAMVYRGTALLRLNRLDEAVTAWSHLVDRFGESEAPEIIKEVATALENKAVALLRLNRPAEALPVTDEVMQRYDGSDAPEILDAVANALVNKGSALQMLNRAGEAVEVWGEVERRFGTRESPKMRNAVKTALLRMAVTELASRQARAAIDAVDRMFRQKGAVSPGTEWLAHMIRAQAHLDEGDVAGCVRDVEAVMLVLPRLSALPKEALDGLTWIAVDLGAELMRKLVRASPAAELLLPLTTALEMELGLEPRVAKEVEEVAEDIRRDLEARRKMKPRDVGASALDFGTGPG